MSESKVRAAPCARAPGARPAECAGIGVGGLRPSLHRHLRQPGRVEHPAHQGLDSPWYLARSAGSATPRADRRRHQPHRAFLVGPLRRQQGPPEWPARPGRRPGRSPVAHGRPARRCRAATRRRSWSRTSPTTGRPSWPHRVGWPSTARRRAAVPGPRGTTCPSPPGGASAGPWPRLPAPEGIQGPVLERQDAGGVDQYSKVSLLGPQ